MSSLEFRDYQASDLSELHQIVTRSAEADGVDRQSTLEDILNSRAISLKDDLVDEELAAEVFTFVGLELIEDS